MIHLFNPESETYNELGNVVDDQVSRAIKPIVEKAVNDGIALRDLHFILSSAVDLEVSAALLVRNAKFYLKKRRGEV